MRVVITVSQDQKKALSVAADRAGLPLSLWIRAVAIERARGLGALPIDPEKAAARAAHAAGVEERRNAREARRAKEAAVSEAERIEDAAWAQLEAEREKAAAAVDEEAKAAAQLRVTAALEAAVSLQEKRKALEA